MKSVLFVCHGNICRSTMAEYIFKYITDNKVLVESRATSTDEIGNDIYPNTKEQLSLHNIPFDRHYAKQITKEDFDKFDIIVGFDESNINNLNRMFNKSSKIRKLNLKDVDDPWYTRDFDKCYKEIYEGCLKLQQEVEEDLNEHRCDY